MTEPRTANQHAVDINSAGYIEAMLADSSDASELADEWGRYLPSNGSRDASTSTDGSSKGVRKISATRSLFNPPPLPAGNRESGRAAQQLQRRVDALVAAFRNRGHEAADLDPLGLRVRERDHLEYGHYGLTAADEGRAVLFLRGGSDEPSAVSLGELRQTLAEAYCGSVGYEYAHLRSEKAREWLQQRIENGDDAAESDDLKQRVLQQLSRAITFERFVRKKYLGSKTFSLEGAESLVPLLDLALEQASGEGVAEVVIGMAHRGRLNVLANIVGKPPEEIFREFEDQHPDWWRGRGDVKYHLGASGDWRSTDGNDVHVSLCFNPSHLEYINPIALGRIRAKQDRVGDSERKSGMTILIHGDAAFAGEGVVQESLNLAGLDDYRTGGALHVVVNNQIGFTTSPGEGRSTMYATDIARAYEIPVFHVNGEHPLAVARVVRLAMDFRARFQSDVVIDLCCYRRWGHNEADEPTFTQPVMYEAIENSASVHDTFRDQLVESGVVDREQADQQADATREELEKNYQAAQEPTAQPNEPPRSGVWHPYEGGGEGESEFDTGVPIETLATLAEGITTFPEQFHLHPKLNRSVEHRRKIAKREAPVDWATSEALAFASLAVEGVPVRLSGQDSGRGTFSHRHAQLHDSEDGRRINIFSDLSDHQAEVQIVNSPLCEAAALGFEYGYSLDYPDALVMWEAQFGDFVNAGQVIIDQFITSAEDKWRRLSGLVLLLPHGFEGQGPEHSSSRLERFLTLAAEDNIQVAFPTTPAQYYHLLRRQVKRPWRKPLVVLTHKSLLRHPRMASPLEELSDGRFQPLLGDDRSDVTETSRVLLASGKMAYDLLHAREERGRSDIAIVRVEQFYPLSDARIASALEGYSDGTPVVWVQEEPENMGAWPYWRQRFCNRIVDRFPFTCVSREPSASPATGSSAAHKDEQQELIEQAVSK